MEKLTGWEEMIPSGTVLETAARILATLAVEKIYLSRGALEKSLTEMGLRESDIKMLVDIFGKNGGETTAR